MARKEVRLLRLAKIGSVVIIATLPAGVLIDALGEAFPSARLLLLADKAWMSAGCVALLAGLVACFVAVLSLRRLRRKRDDRTRTLLYLRPLDDTGSRKSLENAIFSLVGSRVQVLQLADHGSSITSQTGRIVRLVIAVFVATFTLATLEACGILPDQPDAVDALLPLGISTLLELVYRKVEAASRTRSPVNSLTELDYAIDRARGKLEKRNAFFNRVITIATSPAIWNEAIRRLVELADVILLDISRPGAGLAWELSYCLDTKPERILLVGRQADAMKWLQKDAPKESHIGSMRRLVAGRHILVYDRAPSAFPQALFVAVLEVSKDRDLKEHPAP